MVTAVTFGLLHLLTNYCVTDPEVARKQKFSSVQNPATSHCFIPMHSVDFFPTAMKWRSHVNLCLDMDYEMWLARVRLANGDLKNATAA